MIFGWPCRESFIVVGWPFLYQIIEFVILRTLLENLVHQYSPFLPILPSRDRYSARTSPRSYSKISSMAKHHCERRRTRPASCVKKTCWFFAPMTSWAQQRTDQSCIAQQAFSPPTSGDYGRAWFKFVVRLGWYVIPVSVLRVLGAI